jgi:hypothetical protein
VSGLYYRTNIPQQSIGTAPAANNTTIYTYFTVPTSTTFNRIALRTSPTAVTGTGVVRLGIYNCGTDGKPSTVELDAGTVSVTAASTTFEITINQTLAPGGYFLAFCQQTAFATGGFVGAGSSTTALNQLLSAGTTAPSAAMVISWVETGVSGAFATAGSVSGVDYSTYVWLRVT